MHFKQKEMEEKVITNETISKLKEFRESFKKELFEGKLDYDVTAANNEGYLAEFNVYIEDHRVGFCVSKERTPLDSFVCYYNDLLWGCFNKEDIKQLQEIAIKNIPELNEEVALKIKELESQIMKLKKNGI